MISQLGISIISRRAVLCATLVTSSLLVVANPASAQIGNLAKQGDITPLCGTKPAVVALVDGYGGAAWFKTVAQEFRDEHTSNRVF